MGKTITILALAFVLGLGAFAIAHGPGMWGRGYGWNCPGYGYHMGPGWGHGPWRSGPGYGREYGPGYQQPQKLMEEKELVQRRFFHVKL